MMSECQLFLIHHILCVLIFAYHCHAARSRNYHHPEPEEWEITCYTCVNLTSNSHCNSLAIDRPCPKGTDFCHTMHIFGEDGESVHVNKKCAQRAECSVNDVGCFHVSGLEGQTLCISCCDLQYCNEQVPMNASTAVLIDTRSTSRTFTISWWLLLLVMLTAAFT